MSSIYKFYDSAGSTTATTSTGTLTLSGVAVAGCRTIESVATDADKLYYRITNTAGTEWEDGKGVYTASGTTLSRATVIASSNAGALVNFSAGTKNVFIVQPTLAISAAIATAQGSMAYQGAAERANLPIGSAGQLLSSDGSNPAWATIVGGGVKAYSNTDVTSNTVANTTSETAFASGYTISAGSLAAGDVVRLKLWGVYSTNVVAPNITVKIKIGATTVLSTGAITAVAAVTNGGWFGDVDLSFFTIGASGTCDAQAYGEFATAATTGLSVNIPNTATQTIDTTASQAVTVTIQWSAASASNTITLRQMEVLILKAQGNSTPVGVTVGGTGLTSITTGDLLYGSASNVISKLGIGSTGQKIGISGGIPVWEGTPIGIIQGGGTSVNTYLSFNSGASAGTVSDPTTLSGGGTQNKAFVAPVACTLYNFTALILESATACNITMTVRVNAADVSPTVTLTNVAGHTTDGSNTVSLSQGDRVCIHYVLNSGTYTNVATASAMLKIP